MKSCYTICVGLLCLLLSVVQPYAQSAILDVESNKQGVLLPRMTENRRNLIVDPAHSLIIYQTNNTAGFYYNEGTSGAPAWRRLSTGSSEPCESRIPIDALPFTISASGSYYVIADLISGALEDGIIISVSNVQVDLNGFAITSGGGAEGNGIMVTAAVENISILNGSIYGWPEDGISAGLATHSNFTDLHISSNQDDGLLVGDQNIIQNCQSRDNGFDGIDTGNNCLVTNCVASDNNDDGIEVGSQSNIKNCASATNADNGFNAGAGCTMTENTATQNGDRGFVLSNGVVLQNNVSDLNTGAGFYLGTGCYAQANVSRSNTGHGFTSFQKSFIKENTSTNNSQSGFHTTSSQVRFEDNHSSTNGLHGFNIAALGDCIVIRNTATSNTPSNYAIGAGNSAGPVVGPDLSTSTNPFSNIGL